MESIAPPLKFLIEIQTAMQNGEAVRGGAIRYLQGDQDSFTPVVRKFILAWDRGHDWRQILKEEKSLHRRAILDLLANGLAGHPIQARLGELKDEISFACDLEIKSRLDLLPLQMLIPLLLFQFPAFLLLLFGPLLTHFIEGLKS